MRFLAALALLGATPLNAQTSPASPTVIFPGAFVVEHRRVETGTDGSTFTTDPVTDYYGGSWLVSVRPNGSRVVLDFARREITEVDVTRGTYWTLTFLQMGDLRRRLARAEERPVARTPQSARVANAAARPEIRIEEIPEASEKGSTGAHAALGSPSGDRRGGLRHLRVSSKGSADVEVWADRSLPLGPAALTALEGFETDALGATVPFEGRTAPELVSAARRSAAALPVRTRFSSFEAEGSSFGSSPGSSPGSSLEDVALRAEPLAAFPQKLLLIGDGFRRVASPLESMVAFAEEEASRDSSRGGR